MGKKKNSESEESTDQIIKRILSEYNKILKKNLKKYELSDLYSFFVATVILLSLNFGTIASFHFFQNGTTFYIGIIVLTILSTIVVLPTIGSGLIHLYKGFYSKKEMVRIVLSYQCITLFVSIVLSLILSLPSPLYYGLLIFGILIFVHPMMNVLYKESKTTEEFNKTIRKVYNVFTIILNILNILLPYVQSTKLIPGL